jgi:tRNA threonylcarbamoyladenosine biosynthesis protein TsaE
LHPAIVKTLVWRDVSQTRRFAVALAALPALQHSFIALHGELGAGKTTLVRHLLRALGILGPIKSPTYALVETYAVPAAPLHNLDPVSSWPVFHFDFYRFADPQEWEDAGFRELFAGAGLKIAEWPDKVAGHLPQVDLDVFIDVEADACRRIRLVAETATGAALLAGVQGC